LYAAKNPEWTLNDWLIPGDTNGTRKRSISRGSELVVYKNTNPKFKILNIPVAASAKLKDPRNDTTISFRLSSLAMKPCVSPAENCIPDELRKQLRKLKLTDWTRVFPRGLGQSSWYAADEYLVYRTRSSYRDEEMLRDVRTGDAKDVDKNRAKNRQVDAKACIVYRSQVVRSTEDELEMPAESWRNKSPFQEFPECKNINHVHAMHHSDFDN
jgi:hypothetical protein